MNDPKEDKAELAKEAAETCFSELRSPEKMVDFVEKLFALGDRHSALYKAIPGMGSAASFSELKEHIEQGKFDLNSVDFLHAEQQFLETATLFPHEPRFQAFRAGHTMTPRDVSIKGIFEGIAYAKDDRDKKMNLHGVDLSYMDFSQHCFFASNLSDTDLSHTVFQGADLVNANLSHANLTGADFRGADLRGANLQGATVSRAIFVGATLDPDMAAQLEKEGAIFHESDPALSS
jgi:uncharacterized protein YjbI with pentapeptide repeats